MTKPLPDIDLNQAISSHGEALLEDAQTRYFSAVAVAHFQVKRLGDRAAANQSDKVDGLTAAAELLERIGQGLQVDGDNLVANLTAQLAQSAANQAMEAELEATQQSLDRANATIAQLQGPASQVANLRAENDRLQAENDDLQQELVAARSRIATLDQGSIDDDARIGQLEQQLSDAEQAARDANAENARLQRELDNVAPAPAPPAAPAPRPTPAPATPTPAPARPAAPATPAPDPDDEPERPRLGRRVAQFLGLADS